MSCRMLRVQQVILSVLAHRVFGNERIGDYTKRMVGDPTDIKSQVLVSG